MREADEAECEPLVLAVPGSGAAACLDPGSHFGPEPDKGVEEVS